MPGFIGLVPPPALDKKACSFMHLSNDWQIYFEL
ncbi:hypothetical protein I656_02923 [Geobacillus sp. WSUCF1]|nr:hypothetical protein I656_02923 [Geobacillus sp. WSUCF1]